MTYDDIRSQDEDKKLRFLNLLCRGNPLFPNLLDLRVHTWPITLSEAHLLFSCSLKTVIVENRNDPNGLRNQGRLSRFQHQQASIHLLAKRSPGLVAFHAAYLGLDHRQDLASGRQFSPIFDLRGLSHLSIRKIAGPSLRLMWLEKISSMYNLQSLAFNMAGFPHNTTSQLQLGALLNLRSLLIHSTSIPVLSTIFQSLPQDVLESVGVGQLQFDLNGTACAHMRVCMHYLATRMGKSLKKFFLGPTRSTVSSISPADISMMSFLQPLTRIHQLRSLTFFPSRLCVITPEDVAVSANSWPDIEEFIIYPVYTSFGTISSPLIQFESMLQLATKCPKLDQLHLHISFTDLPPLDTIPDLNHRLSSLFFYNPESNEPTHLKAIAVAVYRLFPSLKIHLIESSRKRAYPGWWSVMEHIKALQDAKVSGTGFIVRSVFMTDH